MGSETKIDRWWILEDGSQRALPDSEAKIANELDLISQTLKDPGDLSPADERQLKERLLAAANKLGIESTDPDGQPPASPYSLDSADIKRVLVDLGEPDRNFQELQKALLEFGITSRDRVAHFLGQISAETGRGKWFEELGDEAYFRSFLGSQWRYHGHGSIMLTWRDTYAACANYFQAPIILDKPDVVSRPEWRWRTAAWFWTSRDPDVRVRSGRTFGEIADEVRFDHNIARESLLEAREKLASLSDVPVDLPDDLLPDPMMNPADIDLNGAADRVDFDLIMRTVLGTSSHPSRATRWNAYLLACQQLPLPFALDGVLRWKVDRALAYIMPARGDIDYEWWLSGALREGSPPWSRNAPPPPINQVKKGFCAAIPNLMRRKVGKEIPHRTNLPAGVDPAEWDGGIAAYFGGEYGGPYFAGYLHRIQNADADRPHGTLLGSPFWGAAAQGHTGIALGNGRFLDLNSIDNYQSRSWTANAIRRHKLTLYVLPWDWINYDGDEF
jgi:hypothetical protein